VSPNNQYKSWKGGAAFFKRWADIFISLLVFFMLAWLFVIVILLVLLDIGFPIFYQQLRVGKNGKEFYIYKFRTMPNDAEEDGPQLADDDDKRATPIGKKLRKWRLDELPQFWNVLKGDMSIVGPRPERPYFIQEIIKTFPEYNSLLAVRPGITSKGMVKYGYASNVDQMIERAHHDIDYLQNLSIGNDLQVIVETVGVIADGRGK